MTKEKFSYSELRALRNASEGVQRVSENLTKGVRKLAGEIAELGNKGDMISLGDYWLEIQHHSSKIGGYNFLFICKDGVGPEKALDYEGGYLHGDFNCFIAGAEREDIIFFSENITAIIKKFVKKWKDQETRFTKALEKIKIFEEEKEEEAKEEPLTTDELVEAVGDKIQAAIVESNKTLDWNRDRTDRDDEAIRKILFGNGNYLQFQTYTDLEAVNEMSKQKLVEAIVEAKQTVDKE